MLLNSVQWFEIMTHSFLSLDFKLIHLRFIPVWPYQIHKHKEKKVLSNVKKSFVSTITWTCDFRLAPCTLINGAGTWISCKKITIIYQSGSFFTRIVKLNRCFSSCSCYNYNYNFFLKKYMMPKYLKTQFYSFLPLHLNKF
jgi:hypothetical protein